MFLTCKLKYLYIYDKHESHLNRYKREVGLLNTETIVTISFSLLNLGTVEWNDYFIREICRKHSS